MKYRMMMAAVLVLCLACACAAAQTLPGVEVFSPGLVRVSEMLGRGERVEMTAQLGVSDMLYVRDLSVLRQMLTGTQFAYEGGGMLAAGSDMLSITREGEELLSVGLVRDGQRAELTLGDRAFGVDLSACGDWLDGGDMLAGTAILERVPLTGVLEWIEGLNAGDALAAGFSVAEGFAAEQTFSDDGTRLTKINIEGSIAREGEAPWRVSGYLRQPAGRAPKDTFEITLTQDEDNALTLTYSSTRASEITRKNKAGETSVDTTLKLDGYLAGSRVTTRLTVRLRNAWTADGEDLQEKVTATFSLGHTDKTPGRRMQRLNDMSAKLRCVLRLETAEAGDPVVDVGEETTLSASFDGNTFLDIAVSGSASIGGASAAAEMTGAAAAAPEEIEAAFEAAAVSMAELIYAQLDEDVREKIENGLE